MSVMREGAFMKIIPLLTLAGALCLVGLRPGQAAEPGTPSAVHFGCQARTFGQGVYKDEATLLQVIREMGEVGLEGIETNAKNLERYYDRPADFAAILKQARLKLIGAHLGGSPWTDASRQKALAEVASAAKFVKQMGGQFVVFSGSLPKPRPLPPDTWPQMAEFVNQVGRVCQQSGVRCLYHNHWTECEGDGLETLCRLTDPALVGFAFDTGHALHAGKDPARVIAALGKRLGLIHFSDCAEASSASAVNRPPLGTGRLDMRAVVAALREARFDQWIVLEEESSATEAGRSLAEKGLATMRAAFQPPK
jgi:inosose dehydratase